MIHNHSHLHTHDGCEAAHQSRGKKLLIAIALNLFISLSQGAAALFSGSLSLLSDALHNLSDVVSLGVSWVAEKLSLRATNSRQTFGYRRAEILAAFFNSLLLIGISIFLCREAVQRFWEPVSIETQWVMAMAALGIAGNGLSLVFLHREQTNLNMASAYLHLLADLFTSLAVFVGGAAIHFWGIVWLDSVLTLFVGLYLIFSAFQMLLKTLSILMLFSPPHLDLKMIEKEVLSFPHIANMHHVHLWPLSTEHVHMEAHLDFQKDLTLGEATDILEKIRHRLQEKFGITHVIFQPEIHTSDSKELIASHC